MFQDEIAELRSELEKEHAAREQAERERDHYKNACISQSHEVEQILGKALGYPWYKDDKKNFPGATKVDGVCVGEHVSATLAQEITVRLAAAREKIAALESQLKDANLEIHQLEYLLSMRDMDEPR